MRLRFIILIITIFPVLCFSQMENFIEEDPEPTVKRHRGFAYNLLEYGSGLGLFAELPMKNFYHIGIGFDVFMLRDSKEFTIPYYGYYYQINKRNNVYMFDLMLSLKKRLLAHTLDNSIRPFVAAQLGPVFAMNFPEKYLDADGEYKQDPDQYMWTFSGLLSVGFHADVNNNMFMGLLLEYRIIPFREKLGERQDQSTIDVRLEIGQKF